MLHITSNRVVDVEFVFGFCSTYTTLGEFRLITTFQKKNVMATYDGFYHLASNDLSTWDDPEIDKAKMQNASLAVGEFSTTGMELLFENYPEWHETWGKKANYSPVLKRGN